MTLMSNMGQYGRADRLQKTPFDQRKAAKAINNIEQLAVETPTVFERDFGP